MGRRMGMQVRVRLLFELVKAGGASAVWFSCWARALPVVSERRDETRRDELIGVFSWPWLDGSDSALAIGAATKTICDGQR